MKFIEEDKGLDVALEIIAKAVSSTLREWF